MFYIESSLTSEKAIEVFDLIKRLENMSLLWLPGGGRTHFGYNLQIKAGLESFIPDKLLKKLTFLLIDFDSDFESFKDQVKDSIEIFTDTTNVFRGVKALTKSNTILYFVLDNFVYDSPKLRYLNLIRSINFQHIKFIFLSSFAELYSSKHRQIATENYMFHNVISIPYFNSEDAHTWIKTSAREVGISIDNEVIDGTLRFCGGIPALIKNYLRGLKKYKTHDNVTRSEEMNNIVHSLWNAFSEGEKSTLKRVHFTKQPKVPEPKILDYLKENNLVNQDNEIIGEWIRMILETDDKVFLKIEKNLLYWDGYDITDAFNEIEIKVLIMMIKKQGLIKREDIGNIVYNGHYTEWAIDKFISRLRKKLFDIGIGKDKIVTLKSKGYKIRNLKLL